MALNVGIVGLPNVGKSTLFNALTAAGAAVANYPFCTIDPNVGVVEVPDGRLDRLVAIYKPRRRIAATVQFVDIAGLVKGASQGEGLGNRFLANIREVDAIAHVVRCFAAPDVVHVPGEVEPLRDIETIEVELALADLETIDKRIEKAEKRVKTGDAEAKRELDLLRRLREPLSRGERPKIAPSDDAALLKTYQLLTLKPVLYVANVGEEDPQGRSVLAEKVRARAAAEGAEMAALSAQIEAEIAAMAPGDRAEFLRALGIEEPGLWRLARAAYRLLGLITFFTVGEDEVRAWTIRAGTKAPQAAGVIHSDFERGFIRAETVSYDDLIAAGSMAAARDRGRLRSEGREYVVQDGDVLHFRFNV